MQRIRKGDEVLVIAGKDKGKKGVVIARVDETHVTVEGVNVVKKAVLSTRRCRLISLT